MSIQSKDIKGKLRKIEYAETHNQYTDLPRDTHEHSSSPDNQTNEFTKEESSDFQFVNITTTPRISKDSKSLIRVQVMKNFHRRKQKQKSSNGTEDDDSPSGSAMPMTDLAGHVNKFRLGPWGLQQRPTPPRAPRRKGGKGQPRVSLAQDQGKSSSEERILEAATGIDEADFSRPQVNSKEIDVDQTAIVPMTGSPSYEVLIPEDLDSSLFLTTLEDFEENMFLPEDVLQDVGRDSIELLFSDPGTGYKDPFDTTPLLDSSWTQFILNYCKPSYSHTKIIFCRV